MKAVARASCPLRHKATVSMAGFGAEHPHPAALGLGPRGRRHPQVGSDVLRQSGMGPPAEDVELPRGGQLHGHAAATFVVSGQGEPPVPSAILPLANPDQSTGPGPPPNPAPVRVPGSMRVPGAR